VQPFPRLSVGARFAGTAEHGKPEEVVEAAAVDPDGDDLAAGQQFVERKRRLGILLPMVRAGPVVGLERKPDLDVEVLARPAAHLLLAGDLCRLEVLDQPRNRHRAVAVGRHHRPVRRVAPRAGLDDVVREFVQHRQHRPVGATVPDGARLHQLVAENSGRRIV
jgi:hypothetical protein